MPSNHSYRTGDYEGMQNSLSQMVGNSTQGDVPDLFSTMLFTILLQVKVFILIFRGYANAHLQCLGCNLNVKCLFQQIKDSIEQSQ